MSRRNVCRHVVIVAYLLTSMMACGDDGPEPDDAGADKGDGGVVIFDAGTDTGLKPRFDAILRGPIAWAGNVLDRNKLRGQTRARRRPSSSRPKPRRHWRYQRSRAFFKIRAPRWPFLPHCCRRDRQRATITAANRRSRGRNNGGDRRRLCDGNGNCRNNRRGGNIILANVAVSFA